ncbi:MAG: hypothetical protein K9N51_01380 [Candidatus Pacebacteria bacterium]|nr:hypothetical protein [Candidatus Paceibacterota bacterium]
MINVEARTSMGWSMRMLLAGLAFTAFGLWSLYDGKVKYPRMNRRIEAFETFREEHRLEEWEEYAIEQGWPAAKPDSHDHKTAWDIRTQFIMAAICLPIGLLVLGRLVWTLPKRMGADDDGVITTSGERVPYDAITRVDRRKWNRKGIVIVHWEHNHDSGAFKIDDWIFAGGADILHAIEDHVPREISGAPPEEDEETLSSDEESVDMPNDDADTAAPPENRA